MIVLCWLFLYSRHFSLMSPLCIFEYSLSQALPLIRMLHQSKVCSQSRSKSDLCIVSWLSGGILISSHHWERVEQGAYSWCKIDDGVPCCHLLVSLDMAAAQHHLVRLWGEARLRPVPPPPASLPPRPPPRSAPSSLREARIQTSRLLAGRLVSPKVSRCRLFEDISRRSPEEQTVLEEAWKSRRWNSLELVRCCIIYWS